MPPVGQTNPELFFRLEAAAQQNAIDESWSISKTGYSWRGHMDFQLNRDRLGASDMFAPDIHSFHEFVTGEKLPLSTVHNAVLEFLEAT